jgi:hypothetical protein
MIKNSNNPHRPQSQTIFFLAVLAALTVICPFSSLQAQVASNNATAGKHFDRVLIVVLENQNYASAMQDDFMRELASKGGNFSNFKNLTHPSYPNYLAMIAGSTFGTDGSDSQQDFPDDAEHRTIGDMLNWRNYAEGYPGDDKQPFIRGSRGKYARKHVPFLSFEKVQKTTFKNVVSVDTSSGNPFVSDIAKFRQDPEKNSLPQYIYYSPNMDDDGHDPYFNARKGMRKASTWLRAFLKDWLAFDEKTWLPTDKKMDRLLVVITFDESEGRSSNNIYTVFLGNMVKNQEVKTEYDHYSVLRTIEDNFGLEPLHKDSGDGKAKVITEVWK